MHKTTLEILNKYFTTHIARKCTHKSYVGVKTFLPYVVIVPAGV